MSVVVLTLEDALPDPLLDIQFQDEWSAMRSVHSEREVFAYSVISDSGKLYETEVFVSDLGTICGFCNCPARAVCRHMKAVLADVTDKHPNFGSEQFKPATLKEAAETALKVLTGSDREYALVRIDRPNYTICDMLREALGLPPQDRSDWT